MNSSQVLTLVAVFAIALAAFNLIITMDKVGKLTGYAGQYGNATLVVEQTINVSFVVGNDSANWSTGSVNPGTYGVLWTNGTNLGVTGFQPVIYPLKIENYGNVNATINLSSNATAAQFIGGGNVQLPNPFFRWRITNSEPSSCGGVLGVPTYTDVTVGSPGIRVCNNLSHIGYPTRNTLAVDLEIGIPGNAQGGKAVLLTLYVASIE